MGLQLGGGGRNFSGVGYEHNGLFGYSSGKYAGMAFFSSSGDNYSKRISLSTNALPAYRVIDGNCTMIENEFNPDETTRSYSTTYANQLPGFGHARSMLDSAQAWTPQYNGKIDWIQLDLGDVKEIAGVVTQARKDSNQYVSLFNVSVSDNGINFSAVPGVYKGSKTQDRLLSRFHTDQVGEPECILVQGDGFTKSEYSLGYVDNVSQCLTKALAQDPFADGITWAKDTKRCWVEQAYAESIVKYPASPSYQTCEFDWANDTEEITVSGRYIRLTPLSYYGYTSWRVGVQLAPLNPTVVPTSSPSMSPTKTCAEELNSNTSQALQGNEFSGSVFGNQTLSGSIDVTSSIFVAPGAVLTILAGTNLSFKGDYQISVGGKLVAQGTADAPITMQSDEALGTKYSSAGCFPYGSTTTALWGHGLASYYTATVDPLQPCVDRCATEGFAFASLRHRGYSTSDTTCECGTIADRFGTSNACSYACTTGTGICGGSKSMSVYHTGERQAFGGIRFTATGRGVMKHVTLKNAGGRVSPKAAIAIPHVTDTEMIQLSNITVASSVAKAVEVGSAFPLNHTFDLDSITINDGVAGIVTDDNVCATLCRFSNIQINQVAQEGKPFLFFCFCFWVWV